jgi:hypothetical protein
MNLDKSAAIKIFGKGDSAVSFIAVGNLCIFDQRTQELYKSAGITISSNYALISFQREICELLFNLNSTNRQASSEDWNNLKKDLMQKPDVAVHSLMPFTVSV